MASVDAPINVSDLNTSEYSYMYSDTQTNLTMYENTFEQILEDFRNSLYRLEEPVTIVLTTCYILVFVSALLGNMMVLIVILSNKSMRTSITNSYLLNLAVADLLVTLVCIPLTVGETVYRVWIYGYFLCKATNFLQGLCISASVLTIMALSLDRYVAIRHPVRSRQTSSAKCVRITIVCIWLVSGAIMVPLAVVRSLTSHPLGGGETVAMCGEHWPNGVMRTSFDTFLFVFIYIVPGSVVIFSYSSTGCTLMTGDQMLNRSGSEVCHAEKMLAGRKRLARMLLVLAILFAVSWMPYHAVNLYMDYSKVSDGGTSLDMLSYALLLGHSHSAQNPVIYCFMNSSFKKGLRNLIKCQPDMTSSGRASIRRYTSSRNSENQTPRSSSKYNNYSPKRQMSQVQPKNQNSALLGDDLPETNHYTHFKNIEAYA